MARYLLDTNIMSYLIRGDFPALDYRFARTDRSRIFTSAVCEAEVRFGLALRPVKAKVHLLTQNFLEGIEIASWDSKCALQYGEIAARQHVAGKKLSELDTMIAAHALAHDFTLVTRDRAFARLRNLRIEDWTKGPRPT